MHTDLTYFADTADIFKLFMYKETCSRISIYKYAFQDPNNNYLTYREFLASIFSLIGERGEYLSRTDPCAILMHPLSTFQ